MSYSLDVLASTDPVTAALHALHARLKDDSRGTLASYIPELSQADPEQFGLSVVSVEGHIYQAGDAATPFTIQSVSKPFVYALALTDRGPDVVGSRVGVEPSGEPFNAISFEPQSGRPSNPMINAGAIVTASLVRGGNASERFERIRDTLSTFAGRRLELDREVYLSELETGDRNRALAYLMRNTGLLESSVDEAIDVYFRQCALLVTARDLGVMSATLANGGTNPVTGVRCVAPRITEHVLSVMATCGMYDYSGEWLLHVGLPAKSGVAGGLVAVSPSQFGIGVFSPPLDDRGNSVRGIAACRQLSEQYEIHLMHNRGRVAPAIYDSRPASAFATTRIRRRLERDALLARPQAIHVIRLQGDIEFAPAENIVSSLAGLTAARGESLEWLVLDGHRVTRIHPAASRLLDEAIRELVRSETTIVVAGVLQGLTDVAIRASCLDDALAWCEDQLLERAGLLVNADRLLPLREHDVVARLEEGGRDALASALTFRRCAVGESVFDADDDVFCLVTGGRIAVERTGAAAGARSRLFAYGPGTTFSRRSEDAGARSFVAELPSAVHLLKSSGLIRLERTAPLVVARLWESIASALSPCRLGLLTALVLAICVAGCGNAEPQAAPSATPGDAAKAPQQTSEQTVATAAAAHEEEPLPPLASESALPEALRAMIGEPFTGDLDGMEARRMIRVGVAFNRTHYFVDRGTQRGLSYEYLKQFETALNTARKTRHFRIHVVFVPLPRDRLLSALVNGQIDAAAAQLTMTPQRQETVDFTIPLRRNVNEVIVTAPGAPAIATVEDLSGKEVFVRRSSSYYDSLQALNVRLQQHGRPSVAILEAPENLEDDDILEMVDAGLISATVVDDYLADFWTQIFKAMKVHKGAALRNDGDLAVAIRQDSPLLKAEADAFIRRHAIGTAFGNTITRRYLQSTTFARRATTGEGRKAFLSLQGLFRKYGEQYDLDYLLMMAKGYQESRLNQNVRSPVGAIGIMQIMPATGRALKVGDVRQVEPNIHAGIKYSRKLMDEYLGTEPLDDLNRGFFTLASYNAGPSRIRQLRREAERRGLDPGVWFGSVERIAAERIGRETVSYVSNIYKYYIAYRLVSEEEARREAQRSKLKGSRLERDTPPAFYRHVMHGLRGVDR